MSESSRLDLSTILDERRMGPLHWLVVALSFMLMLIDGYDLACTTFVAPMLQKDWGFDRASFGYLFSAATLGTTIGPPICGALADRMGRKPVLLLGSLWFGLFTLACVLATSLQQMVILRFIAGIGIGGVIATAIAYVSEFAPRRVRSTMIVVGVVGLALGGGVGAIIASRLLATHTWHVMFWIGGITPVIVAGLGAFLVPESPKFLAARPERQSDLLALLERLAPERHLSPDTTFVQGDIEARFSWGAAFAGRLSRIVPLLMLCTFMAMFALFFVNQWTTVLLTADGVPVERAALAPGAFQIFGFIGALSVARPIDKFGLIVMPFLFAAAAVAIAVMGLPGLGATALIALSGVTGFCVIGLQFSNIAAAGQIFPTAIRSGGVGLVYGVARFGSFVGPAMAGILIGLQVPLGTVFHLAGAMMLVGVAASWVLAPLYRQQLAMLAENGE